VPAAIRFHSTVDQSASHALRPLITRLIAVPKYFCAPVLKRQGFHLQVGKYSFVRLLFLTGSYIVSRTLRAIAALQF